VVELTTFIGRIRDVTKFKFQFDSVRTSNIFSRFEFNECFKRFVVDCEFVEKFLFND